MTTENLEVKNEEQKMIIEKSIVDKLKVLNNRVSMMLAQIGQAEINVMVIQKDKQAMFEEVDKLNEQVKSITAFISDQYKIKEGRWTLNWDTGEVVPAK